jgi:hypothetical protein
MRRDVSGLLLAGAIGLGGCAASQTASPPVAGQPVRGTSARYELTPAPGWLQLDARADRDLTLRDADSEAGVIVWYYEGADADMDKLVGWRRAALFKRGATDYRERRFFLTGADLVPASLARYAMPGPESLVQVLTVVTERGAVEVLGGSAPGQEQDVNAVLDSLRVLE